MRRRRTTYGRTVRRRDCRALAEALNQAGASELDVRAASILLAANGLNSALAYVKYMRKRNRKVRQSARRP